MFYDIGENAGMMKMNEELPDIKSQVSCKHSVGSPDITPHHSIIPQCGETHITLENGTRVSGKVVKAALSGEFVDLGEFLPIREPVGPYADIEPMVDTHGSFYFRQKKTPRKAITSFNVWLSAWNNYESLLVECQPKLYQGLSSYRQFIQKCDIKYKWHAIYAYDCRFRAKLSQAKCFTYNKIDTELFVMIFDVTTVKQGTKTCYRCHSYEHIVGDCPFPAAEALEENKTQTTMSNSMQQKISTRPIWYHNGKEGCNNFQTGKCKFPQCKRAHVCKSCRGSEPHYRCGTCNQDPTNT